MSLLFCIIVLYYTYKHTYSKVLTHPVLSQELYVHTFLETNDITQAQKIAESCRNSGENNTGVMDWLQTQKNVLTASENSMVKSQVMVETENRISPILDHMANAVKHAPKALACSENYLQKQQKSTATLWQKRAEASLALYQVDTSATGAAASMQQVCISMRFGIYYVLMMVSVAVAVAVEKTLSYIFHISIYLYISILIISTSLSGNIYCIPVLRRTACPSWVFIDG